MARQNNNLTNSQVLKRAKDRKGEKGLIRKEYWADPAVHDALSVILNYHRNIVMDKAQPGEKKRQSEANKAFRALERWLVNAKVLRRVPTR